VSGVVKRWIKKKAATKKAVAKKRTKHPLMLDGRAWDKEKVMRHILNQIVTTSFGLGTILRNGCDGNTLPGYSAIMEWLDESDHLAERYARAKAEQAEFLADEMLDIVDDCRNDFMEKVGANGETYEAVDKEHIQRSRLRVETRKWLMGKLKPKKYGDKLDVNHGGQEGSPLLILARSVQGSALPVKSDDD